MEWIPDIRLWSQVDRSIILKEPNFSGISVLGGICLGPIMAGTLIGGWIIKRFNWKVRGVLFFGFVTTVLGSFTSLGILSNCHTKLIAGANVDYAGKYVRDVCPFHACHSRLLSVSYPKQLVCSWTVATRTAHAIRRLTIQYVSKKLT